MTEFFDVLDEQGNKTGKTKARAEVHRDGDWHRAVHIWIVNDKNEALLQKRSPNKDSHPNMWDISSAGHLIAGEDNLATAVREIKEELGVDVSASDLRLIGSRKKFGKYATSFINNEFQDVYLLRMSLDVNKLRLQPEEVSEAKFVPIDELKHMLEIKDKTLFVDEDEFKMLVDALSC